MRFHGELSEWPKEHDWKSCIRRKRILGSNPRLSVECGGLENRLPLHGVRGFESLLLRHLVRQTPRTGAFFMSRLQPLVRRSGRNEPPFRLSERTSDDWSVNLDGTSPRSVSRSGPVTPLGIAERKPWVWGSSSTRLPQNSFRFSFLAGSDRAGGVHLVDGMFQNGINASICIARICMPAVRYPRTKHGM